MRKDHGFTLVELLVAIGIFGLLLVGLATLLSSTLRFSSVSISAADRLREVEAAAGYVADNVRRASDIDVGTCTVGSLTQSCAAVIVPSASTEGGAIDTYEIILFRYVSREDSSVSFLPNDTYADANTIVLTESRNTVMSSTPADVTVDTSVAGWQGPFIVLDQVSPTAAGFAITPTGAVEILVQIADQVRGVVRQTPSSGTYTLIASPRNAP